MFDTIEQIIAEHFGLNAGQLVDGKTRPENDAKHFLWYFLHTVLGYSNADIATRYKVSVRNVIYYASLIRDSIGIDPYCSKNCREIQDKLKELDMI